MSSGMAGECAGCQMRQFSIVQSWLCRQNSSLFPLKDTTGCCALLVKCSRLPVESLTCFTLAIRLSPQRACIQCQQWTPFNILPSWHWLQSYCLCSWRAAFIQISHGLFPYFLAVNSLLCGLRWQINIAYVSNSTEIILQSLIIWQ